MAFYSYVMMNNVRVGIEAIVHAVREQHDKSAPEERELLATCSAVLVLTATDC